MILHISHSSTVIPSEIKGQFVVSDEILLEEVRTLTDHFTEDLFSSDNFRESDSVIFPINRIALDPERFTVDALESMSEKGMGVIYSHGRDGSRNPRDLAVLERQELLDDYYYPHHDCLEAMVTEELEETGKCLIIDCHSFPNEPFPYEKDQSLDRPDICIGTDSFHTPDWLTERCVSLFEAHGLKTAINTPFSGSLVPSQYYLSNKKIMSIMIEVNRKLYLDEKTGIRNDNYNRINSIIRNIFASLQ